jgi:PleD family two-component response regulator
MSSVTSPTRVDTRAEFVAALKDAAIDLILADYKLPSFDGIAALELVVAERPDVPFIFVSGTVGEELAIEALTMGATDYVLKQRLSRPHGELRLGRRQRRHLLVRGDLSDIRMRAGGKAHRADGDRPHASGRPAASPASHRTRADREEWL